MKFVNPKNDVAFKKIFGDENHKPVLISFLNAVLNLSGEKEIVDVDILNPYQTPHLALLKYTLLDVRATDRRGIHFIVEMQNERVPGLRKRFQYYAAKSYAQQIERGEDYPKLNQVIFIGILDFKEFSNPGCLSRHVLLNVETGIQELHDLEFNFIELPKFSKAEHELLTILDKWIYFIKHAADLRVIPSHASAAPLREAYEIANQFGWSKEDLDVYDYWSMKEQDERGAVELALETGIQQGMQQGMQQGIQQGIQQGDKAGRVETARNMLADGMALEIVLKYTGLSAADLAGD
jgi:predicted transposase/invertase (TIGR01784 family)